MDWLIILISSDFIVHVLICFFLDCSGQIDIVDCPAANCLSKNCHRGYMSLR